MELLLPIGLIALGLALVVVEVYLVPGFNLVGIMGFLVIVFGVGYVYTEHGLTGGIVTTVGVLAAGAALFYLFWRSGAWDRFVLRANLPAGNSEPDGEPRTRYLGRTGVALTPLRPTGIAQIEGERIEVATEGEFIATGSKIRVVAMDRRRYFVRLDDV